MLRELTGDEIFQRHCQLTAVLDRRDSRARELDAEVDKAKAERKAALQEIDEQIDTLRQEIRTGAEEIEDQAPLPLRARRAP